MAHFFTCFKFIVPFTTFYFICGIFSCCLFSIYVFIFLRSVCCSWNVNLIRATPCLVSSLPYPQHLKWCLACGKCSINICWMNELMKKLVAYNILFKYWSYGIISNANLQRENGSTESFHYFSMAIINKQLLIINNSNKWQRQDLNSSLSVTQARAWPSTECQFSGIM